MLLLLEKKVILQIQQFILMEKFYSLSHLLQLQTKLMILILKQHVFILEMTINCMQIKKQIQKKYQNSAMLNIQSPVLQFVLTQY